MAGVERLISEGASSKELRAAMGRYRQIVASDAPSFDLLVSRFGGGA